MASLPYNIETNLTYRAILMARTAFTDVATGKRIMVLVSSDPGYGKTLLAKRELRVANAAFDETGSITTERDFVRYMWQIESGIICHKGRRIRALLVDDKDGLLRRETIANQLKAGFGADRRRIRFTSNEAKLNEDYRNSDDEGERKKYKAIIPATSFDVTVGMICLANIDYTDPAVVAGLPHFSALVSKGLDPQRIPNDAENGGRDVFLYTHHLATVQNSLGGEGYTYEVARAAVEFYVHNVHRLIDIPPRRLSMIAKVIKDNPDPAGREERLDAMLRPTDQRPRLKLPEEWIPVLLWSPNPPSRPNRQPDPDPPPAASAPGPVEPEPDPEPPPAGSAPISIAPEPLPTPGSQAEPPSRTAILQDTARMLRGRITQAMITGTAERLEINGYDEDRRVLIEAEWPAQPSIQDEFLLRLLGPAEAKEIRGFLAHNGTDLPKGHIPIREIKATQVKFKVHDIEWTFTCGREAKADLIAGARRAKVTRPWLGSCVQLHAVDGRIAFERSPFEYGFGDLEWALKKPWTSLSAARDGLVKMIVPGLLGNFVIYLRGCETGLAAEIERQRQMADIAELTDRANLHQIDDAFDNYWPDDLPSEPPVASGPEPAPTIEEPRSEDLSPPEIVERNRAAVLGAILDTVLPPGDRRQGAFFGAVEQVKAMGGIVDERVLGYIRRGLSDEAHRVAAIFAWDTTRQILDRASIVMTSHYQTNPSPTRELNSAPAIDIDKITMERELDDAEMRHLTLQWGLKPFRGRAGPLDIVAYQRRCGFLKIAGTTLTRDQLRDQLVIVRKKPKGFWQEQGAAEHWLAEILSQSTHDDLPQEEQV